MKEITFVSVMSCGTMLYLYSDDRNITSIVEHQAQGEGDKHWIDVVYEDGTSARYFNIDTIKYEEQ